MEQVYNFIVVLGIPLIAVGVVGAIITYILARQISGSREELRVLRIALERDPSPVQVGQALRLWPDVAQLPKNIQPGEMVKRAHVDEGKRAERAEATLGICRTFIAIAVVGIAIVLMGRFWHPFPKV
jgi:hypothetical protein